MGDKTGIEWTDATWTPIRARNKATGQVGWFCVHASDGCRNCYAEGINRRLGTQVDYRPVAVLDGQVELFLDEELLLQPLRWKRPRKIFVCSMTDLFLEQVPTAWIERIYAVMALANHHTYQVVTKRAKRMREISLDDQTGPRVIDQALRIHGLPHDWAWPLPNVWHGVSVENQRTADERLPLLIETATHVRIVSAEPLLGEVDIVAAVGTLGLAWIDQVIVGGESGPKARPMHVAWARLFLKHCEAYGIAFFLKQWGEYLPEGQFDKDGFQWAPGSKDARVHWWGEPVTEGPIPDGACSVRVGKKQAGRSLDGRTHDAMPRVTA